jgi:NAD(P)H-hydrate epimerase
MLTCAQMKALEERAFAEGVSAEALMDEAGAQIAEAVRQFFPRPGRCLSYFGKGHNGGDALVAARHLAIAGWNIALPVTFPEAAWSELTAKKYRELQCVDFSGESHDPESLIVLDGLLGIGAGGALREPIKRQARAINASRARSNARVFAIDLPTGLDGDTGAADADAVVADYTLTIGAAKIGLLADEATRFVGRLAVLPLRELTTRMDGAAAAEVATPAALAQLLSRRNFDMHKGDCGRVGIVAGAPGMIGAAVMCAEAAVHSGAGLVTLYVTEAVQPIVAARIAPEVMVRTFSSIRDLLDAGPDVLAIGPGLGRSRDVEVLELAAAAPQPMVIDADALTALAPRLEVLSHAAGPRLLTPHPGEMRRLDPDSAKRSRRETVEAFTARFPATLLLKGARTLIGERGRPLSYNTTGSPGMATGGMGDVLTGVCAGLAAQGLALYDAARLGAWLCGRAAELALLDSESEESLSATHVIAHLGAAFRALRADGY